MPDDATDPPIYPYRRKGEPPLRGPVLCAEHAHSLVNGDPLTGATCDQTWRDGHGRTRRCDVMANPERVAHYHKALGA